MKLNQVFENRTSKTLVVNLEPYLSRYKLEPNEEIVLHYNHDETTDGPCAPVRVELIESGGNIELNVWAADDQMYLKDGSPAPLRYDP